MAVTPSGLLSLPSLNLATLLSNSASFQTWVGTPGNSAAALATIQYQAADDFVAGSSTVTRPFGMVIFDTDDPWSFSKSAESVFSTSGSLQLYFEDEILLANRASHTDAFNAFMNDIGPFISEMAALVGSLGQYLRVRDFIKIEGPYRVGKQKRVIDTDIMYIIFRIDWGTIA